MNQAEKIISDIDEIYPCDKCGKLRSKKQGGTVFTLCDECWDKHYHPEKYIDEVEK